MLVHWKKKDVMTTMMSLRVDTVQLPLGHDAIGNCWDNLNFINGGRESSVRQ